MELSTNTQMRNLLSDIQTFLIGYILFLNPEYFPLLVLELSPRRFSFLKFTPSGKQNLLGDEFFNPIYGLVKSGIGNTLLLRLE